MMFYRTGGWILRVLAAVALLRAASLTQRFIDSLPALFKAELARQPHDRFQKAARATMGPRLDLSDPDTLERLLRGAVAECADIDLLLQQADRPTRSRRRHLPMGARGLTA